MAVKKITETEFKTVSEMTEQDPNGFVEYQGKFYRMTMRELGALIGIDRTTQVHEFVQQWIEAHPEDVIMLKDGSISLEKLTNELVTYLANETELDIERKRIDALIAGGEITGDFDVEVADARTQWNGTVATSLGTAIRNQFNAIFTNLVAVQTTEPTAPENKVWIEETEEEYEVPTVEDMENAIKDKMERYIIKLVLNGSTYSIQDYTTSQNITFNTLKEALSDTSKYVVCVYGNTKLRPQYVSTSEIVFTGLSRDASGADAIRMIVRPTGVSYDVFPLQKEGDFATHEDLNNLGMTVVDGMLCYVFEEEE